MPFSTTRRVEFRETDCAGIAHFSNFFGYMEEAEHELLRQVGLSVVMNTADGKLSWPRVHASCDYRAPVKFEDELQVQVCIERLGDRSVTYLFTFKHGDVLVATGKLVAVCALFSNGGPPRGTDIPVEIRGKLELFLTSAAT